MNIAGYDFEIIGLYDKARDYSHDDYITDFDTFIETGLSQDQIYLYSKKEQDVLHPENDPVRQLILETYNCGINDAGPLVQMEGGVTDAVSEIEITQIIICYCISTVCFMFLMVYMIDSLRTESVISMIVGATRTKLRVCTLTEVFVLTSVSSLAGILIHKLLYNSFFSGINLREGIVYTFTDYLKIFGLMLSIAVIVEIPFVLRYTRLDPAQARRRRMP